MRFLLTAVTAALLVLAAITLALVAEGVLR
jgi:hypothetical protein